MVCHIMYPLLLITLEAATAQFMPHMQQSQLPYYPHQGSHPQPQMTNAMAGGMTMGFPPGMHPPMLPNLPHSPGMYPQMPVQMQLPMTGRRLPMVVMPHHTKKHENKRPKKTKRRNRKRIKVDSSLSDDSCESDDEYKFRTTNDVKSSRKRRREVLTPVVSYVTKDGYVVYQKKIKKDKAKDWLEMPKVTSAEFKDKAKKKHRH